MSLVEYSHATGQECMGIQCGHTIHGPAGYIGKDLPIFDDAINFVKEIEDQW